MIGVTEYNYKALYSMLHFKLHIGYWLFDISVYNTHYPWQWNVVEEFTWPMWRENEKTNENSEYLDIS